MQETERIFSLDEVRTDGWLDEMAGESDDFNVVFDAIGKRTVGLALVAGVKIQGLSLDPQFRESAFVKFVVGDNTEVHSLPVIEFRRRVGGAVLAPVTPDVSLGENPSVDDLQAFIGGRELLIAALFELQPMELRVVDEHALVVVRFGDLERKLAIEDFRTLLADRVRNEMGVAATEHHTTVNLDAINEAVDATERGDWYATISVLSPWLTPISMLMRTGEAQALTTDVHETLSQGLGLLGTAYAKVGEVDTANEVLRLGVQWAGEGEQAQDLFLRLGETSIEVERHGEAIGLLRRARALGCDDRRVMPMLAISYLARGQKLAALACARAAVTDGAAPDSVEDVTERVEPDLAAAWSRFTEFIEK